MEGVGEYEVVEVEVWFVIGELKRVWGVFLIE